MAAQDESDHRTRNLEQRSKPMNGENTMSRDQWRDFRLSTRNAGYWPGVREGSTPANRRRPLYQRLLWRLSRQIPLDDLSLSSPLVALSAMSFAGSLLALALGFHLMALVFGSTMLGCLACHLRRHASPRTTSSFKQRSFRK
ncbi:hypothetical protein [Prosthecobacter sp.]|uniref:hypothetical protein n=1 Tax=Prosthecobacter sp. TaxID=1965333 RepID=UPI003784FD02